MIIKKLAVRSFGKMQDLSLELSDGINVLYGKNESGKTTFYHFLKSILYGMRRKRGKGAGTDEFTRFEPWEGANWYGGTIWFEQSGAVWRLTRNFRRESASFELMREGEPARYSQEDLNGLLDGVSEAVYENTVSIGQLRSATGTDLARELTDYMASSQGTGDCRLSLEKAGQLLKMERKGYTDLREKRDRQNQQELDKLKDREAYLEEELAQTRDRQQEVAAKKEKVDEACAQDAAENHEDPRVELWAGKASAFRLAGVGMTIVGLSCLLLAGAAWLDSPLVSSGFYAFIAGALGRGGWLVLWGVVGGVCLLGAVISYAKSAGLRSRSDRLDRLLRKRKKRMEDRLETEKKLGWVLEGLKEQEKERKSALENLREETAELEASYGLATPEDTEIEAINLALEQIRISSGKIRARVESRLRERTGEILSGITDGKYRQVLVDEELHIEVGLPDRMVPLDRLSRGTIEQVYFALRMASAEILCGKADFPVILDDVFGNYDEERLTAVLRWLENAGHQVILCTCSRREESLLEAAGIRYDLIELEEV